VSGRSERTAKAAKSGNPATRKQAPKRAADRTEAAGLLTEVAGLVPKSDAEYLLMHLLRVPRHELYLGSRVTASTASKFSRLVARARAGEPVQYLVGSAPFLDFDVRVDRRVLIPRPETEELVARAIVRLQAGLKLQAVGHKPLVVDFGTGSGCIAIALARALPAADVLAVDASKPALAVARMNVARFGLKKRIRLAQARTIDQPALARLRGRLDLLISNPPYVPTRRLARLDRAVGREPRLALDGGPKGANIVAMLLAQGPELLKPGGLLAVEIDATHEAVIRKLAPRAEIERDLAGRTRYAFLYK
jgi:release factor glutamine methyltransferase